MNGLPSDDSRKLLGGTSMGREKTSQRMEQRSLLRKEGEPPSATIIVRGGIDTRDKLRRHAHRTARAWSLDGKPLLGISVFAALGSSLEDLLRRKFASFRMVYLPTVARLAKDGFHLLPTGQHPHFTVRLSNADDLELGRLRTALGAAQANPQYCRDITWQEAR
jgi:hypothetical protein